MKKFILASVIFIITAMIGILMDAVCGYYLHAWNSMPNLIYFALGWIAAGCYLYFSSDKK